MKLALNVSRENLLSRRLCTPRGAVCVGGPARLFVLCCRISRRRTRGRMSAHRVLSEGQGVLLFAFFSVFQNLTAHERQVLQADAILPAETQVRANRKGNPVLARDSALKREDSESPVLSKSGEKKLHLWAP